MTATLRGNKKMRGRLIIGLLGSGGLMLLGGLMASCTPNTAAPILQPRTGDLPTTTPDSIAIAANLPPTPVWLEPFTDQTCLDCHTDQAQLTTLAKPDEPTESLSEGPG
mgnify:CR=1 FL=1